MLHTAHASGLDQAALDGLAAEIKYPPLMLLYDYWRGLRRGRPMPARADIDPIEIPRAVLANALLIDVEWQKPPADPPFRLRFRLVGTAVVAPREGLRPQDPTGYYLDEIELRLARDAVSGFYGRVAASGRPAYEVGTYAPDHPRFSGMFHRLALPLSETGDRPSMLLAGFCRGETAYSR